MRIYTRKQAAKYLGISLAMLDQARKARLITYVQYVTNGCVYFKEEHLQEYIAKCTYQAKPIGNMVTFRKPRTR